MNARPGGRAETGRPAGKIRVGIGGWSFAPWRGSFYPAGLPHARELEYASSQLTSIEINGTFYRHQSEASFAAWAEAVPDNFVFAVKAHRATTHGKILADSGPAIERFLHSGIAALGEKLGPILWQFPPTRKFDPASAAAFLESLPLDLSGRNLMHAVEARHASFDDPAWFELLRRRGIAHVIVDSDKQVLRGDRTAAFCYLRLQRNTADEKAGYPTDALDAWADRVTRWSHGEAVNDLPMADPGSAVARSTADCFVYFISGDKAHAPIAARALMARLKQGK